MEWFLLNPAKSMFFTITALMVMFAGLGCMYALRWQLAEHGVSTVAQGWWPPLILRVWRAALAIQQGPKWLLLWWGSLMWVCFALTAIALPIQIYITYLAVTGLSHQ